MMKPKLFVVVTSTLIIFSCSKSVTPDPVPVPPVPPVTPAVPTDPAIANTIGFFLDDWAPKTFTAPAYTNITAATGTTSATVTIDAADIITKVPQSIFGNNANSWMTQMITEAPLMSYLTNYHSHLIRFPGGSISDLYFWNRPANTAPADAPATRVDENGNNVPGGYWFGKITDSWTISVDNYYNMLQQTGNKGMITINYGYARYGTSANPVATAAKLAADWVRYDNGRTKYWEIGNENFGAWEAGYRINTATNGDGQPQLLNGKVYGEHFKVFADSMRKAATEIGKQIYIAAVLMEKAPASYIPANLQAWNADVMQKAGSSPDYYVVHNYFTPYQQDSNPETILSSVLPEEATMMNYVRSGLSSAGITQKPVALTEWNIFAEGSGQQVSYINGIHGLLVMAEALNQKFGMAARWDLANGWNNGNDMGLFNIGDEPGIAKWNARASYYYMYFFQKTAGDRLVRSAVAGNVAVKAYASTYNSGQVATTLVNTGSTSQVVSINLQNFTPGNRYYYYVLTGGSDNGVFSKNVLVNGIGSSAGSGGPENYHTLNALSTVINGNIKIDLPPYGVINLLIDK